MSATQFTRDSSVYEATIHAMQMMRDRDLTGPMVEEAIEEGEQTGGGKGGCVELRHRTAATDLEVVINPEEHNVVTAVDV